MTEEDQEADPLTRAPNCLAFHPSGYYFALGFIDKIRLFHLMLHEIRSFRELTVKNTSILKFSHEGNLLACVSGRAIFIYSAYSLQLLETLRGHKGPISSIS